MSVLKKVITRTELCILLVTIASFIVSIYGRFPFAPVFVKVLYSVMMWSVLLVFPYKLMFNYKNKYSVFGHFLILVLLLLGILSIFVTVFNNSSDLYEFGDKYLTLFGNYVTALLFLPPICAFLALSKKSISLLNKYVYVYLITSIFLFFLLRRSNMANEVLVYVPLFIPYVKRRVRWIIYVNIAIYFINGLDGSRANFINLFIVLLALILVYHIKSLLLIKIVCCIFIILPFTLLLYSLITNQSVISNILSLTSNQSLSTDTRSFLYIEMFDDLRSNNAILFGKGAYSHYYSDFFFFNGGDSSLRIGSEVPVLNFMLKGGLIYVLVYIITIIAAVYKALRDSKNKFLLSVAVLLSGFMLTNFVSDLTGSNILHLGIWLLIGCCFTKTWLQCSDDQIKDLIK